MQATPPCHSVHASRVLPTHDEQPMGRYVYFLVGYLVTGRVVPAYTNRLLRLPRHWIACERAWQEVPSRRGSGEIFTASPVLHERRLEEADWQLVQEIFWDLILSESSRRAQIASILRHAPRQSKLAARETREGSTSG